MLLWRHGRTAWNDAGRFQGQTDVPLDPVGRAQAARAGHALAGLHPDAIVSSDLARARETAETLAALTALDVAKDVRLRETHGGTLEGLRIPDILERDAAAYRAWRRGEDVAAGGGESRSDVAARAVPAIADAMARLPDDGLLVVVTHGGTARAAIGHLLGLPVELWRVLGGLANCSWSVLERAPAGWRLAEHNAGSLPVPVVGDDR